MKDSILNTALSAFSFAAILFIAFENGSAAPQAPMTQTTGVVVMEKTVITASRLL